MLEALEAGARFYEAARSRILSDRAQQQAAQGDVAGATDSPVRPEQLRALVRALKAATSPGDMVPLMLDLATSEPDGAGISRRAAWRLLAQLLEDPCEGDEHAPQTLRGALDRCRARCAQGAAAVRRPGKMLLACDSTTQAAERFGSRNALER